jgi:hypothetical protein
MFKKTLAATGCVALATFGAVAAPSFAEPISSSDLPIAFQFESENYFSGVAWFDFLLGDLNPTISTAIWDGYAGNTSNAFDGWGDIRVSEASDFTNYTELSFLACDLESDLQPDSPYSSGTFVTATCDTNPISIGGGTVDFRAVVQAQGSFLSFQLFSEVASGSPSPYFVSIGGNLGSDSDTVLHSSGSTSTHNWFVTGGDSEDPAIGYRSTYSTSLDQNPGTAFAPNQTFAWLTRASAVQPAASFEEAYAVELWFVDYYSNGDMAAAMAAASLFADVPFGHCIATVGTAAIQATAFTQQSVNLEHQCSTVLTTELQPVPYLGPVVTNDPETAQSGSTVTYTGSDLDEVTSATIAGQSAAIVSKSAGSLTLRVPAGLSQGMHDVILHYSTTESLTLQNGLVVQDLMKVWTQLQSDNTVKMYAKNIVGEGKIQFLHNGNEIAWVRASNALNPKLRQANGSSYLVRTRELVAGKNAFEIHQDGKRIWRAAYWQPRG